MSVNFLKLKDLPKHSGIQQYNVIINGTNIGTLNIKDSASISGKLAWITANQGRNDEHLTWRIPAGIKSQQEILDYIRGHLER